MRLSLQEKLQMMAQITTGIHAFGPTMIMEVLIHVEDHGMAAEMGRCLLMWDHTLWVRSLPPCPEPLNSQQPPPLYPIPGDATELDSMVIELNDDIAFTIPKLTLQHLEARREAQRNVAESLREAIRERQAGQTQPPGEEMLPNDAHIASSSENSYGRAISEACIGQPHVAPSGLQTYGVDRESEGLLYRLFEWLIQKLLRVFGRG